MRRTSLSFAVTLAAISLPAQQFAPWAGRPADTFLPVGSCSLLAFADLDGDGDADAAANDTTANAVTILRQTGPRAFTATPLLPGIATALATGDIDGDGDLDVLVGGRNAVRAPFGMLRNDGTSFAWLGETPGVAPGEIQSIAVGDVDGDHDLDVVLGTMPINSPATPMVQLFRNTGGGALALAAGVMPPTMPLYPRLALLDRDRDGDLDLAVATPTGSLHLFLWSGAAFTDASANLPAGSAGQRVLATDVDGDAFVDLVVANGTAIDVLWNGAGGFTRQAGVAALGAEPLVLAAGDPDRDLDRDLLVGTAQRVDLVRNLGSRAFAAGVLVPSRGQAGLGTVAVGDLLDRGTDDVVVSWRATAPQVTQEIRFAHAPDPIGEPQQAPVPIGDWPATAVAAGDLDGDQRSDLVFAGANHPVRVLGSNGRGRFAWRVIDTISIEAQEVRVADFDRDGRQDLFVRWDGAGVSFVRPLHQEVGGTFTAYSAIWLNGRPRAMAAGDLDGDQDLDVLVTNGSGVDVLRNVTGLAFVAPVVVPGIAAPAELLALQLADLDGDLDLDVAAACGGAQPALLVFASQGGTFGAPATFALPDAPVALAAADLDRDGDLDLAVAMAGAALLQRNTGNGVFAADPAAFPALPGVSLQGLVAVDVDDDTNVDVLLPGTPAALLRNLGDGTFAVATSRLSSAAMPAAVAVDLDEDGDRDLVVPLWLGRWQAAWNGLRGAESIGLAQPGGAVGIRFRAAPGATAPGTFVLPATALGAGPALAVPGLAGHLLLPPAGLVVEALLAMPSPAGTAVHTIAVPNQPELVGFDVAVQGLVFGSAVTAGFTNVVDERILP